MKMKEGASLSNKSVSDALSAKGLTFVSKSAVADDAPMVVYVLNVGGVG